MKITTNLKIKNKCSMYKIEEWNNSYQKLKVTLINFNIKLSKHNKLKQNKFLQKPLNKSKTCRKNKKIPNCILKR